MHLDQICITRVGSKLQKSIRIKSIQVHQNQICISASGIFVWGRWTRTEWSTKWPNMSPSARSPGSYRHLRKHRLHLNGDKWSKMLLRSQLSAALRHTHRRPNKPFPIFAFLSGIDQCRFGDD